MVLFNINLNSHIYLPQGRIDLGFETTVEALRMAEESGDILSKAHVYTFHSQSCYNKKFLKEAEEHLLMAIDYNERINYLYSNVWGYFCLAQTYFEMGEYQKSQDYYVKAVSLSEHSRLSISIVYLYKMALIRTKVIIGEKDIDLESLYRSANHNKIKLFDGMMRRYIAEILLNIDDEHMNEAEDWINKAIEADARNGTMWHLGRDYALYAKLFKRKGDQSKAKENLNKAIEILKECGADGWVG